MRSYLKRLCKDKLQGGNVGLKAFILTYDIVSCSIMNNGAFVEYLQVEMSLRALQHHLREKLVTQLEPDH
jgi:hypothetical protein